ncbi:uncharacterized protein [Macrobrachium rosenbergii]|uniref:uncharacterized protein n=1 Tax=Macrobrachium rosenbergii TaxID=79674 RepID=UPI0034D3C98D
MMTKTVLTLALLSVSQVFMTCAKPWGSDSHENFFGSVGTFSLPIVASAVAVPVPVARSSAVSAPAAPAPAAPAPAAPAPAAPAPAQAQSVGISHVGFAFGGDDSREFGYDGSNEVKLFAFGANKKQVW